MAFDLIMPPIVGLVGLLVAFVIYNVMSKHDAGPDNVKHIADQIHVGAMVFMHREYKMLAVFAAVLVLGIFLSPLGSRHCYRLYCRRFILGYSRLPGYVCSHPCQCEDCCRS
jgi:Na+/H+-translocating membrane pyrophosphatase